MLLTFKVTKSPEIRLNEFLHLQPSKNWSKKFDDLDVKECDWNPKHWNNWDFKHLKAKGVLSFFLTDPLSMKRPLLYFKLCLLIKVESLWWSSGKHSDFFKKYLILKFNDVMVNIESFSYSLAVNWSDETMIIWKLEDILFYWKLDWFAILLNCQTIQFVNCKKKLCIS